MYLLNISMGQECMGYKPHELAHNPPHFSDEKIEGQRSDLQGVELAARTVCLTLGPA